MSTAALLAFGCVSTSTRSARRDAVQTGGDADVGILVLSTVWIPERGCERQFSSLRYTLRRGTNDDVRRLPGQPLVWLHPRREGEHHGDYRLHARDLSPGRYRVSALEGRRFRLPFSAEARFGPDDAPLAFEARAGRITYLGRLIARTGCVGTDRVPQSVEDARDIDLAAFFARRPRLRTRPVDVVSR